MEILSFTDACGAHLEPQPSVTSGFSVTTGLVRLEALEVGVGGGERGEVGGVKSAARGMVSETLIKVEYGK